MNACLAYTMSCGVKSMGRSAFRLPQISLIAIYRPWVEGSVGISDIRIQDLSGPSMSQSNIKLQRTPKEVTGLFHISRVYFKGRIV